MKKFLILLFIINSCSYPELTIDKLIYENDFEGLNTENIDGAGISLFNNSNVLGNYNNDGFTFHIDNIESLKSSSPTENRFPKNVGKRFLFYCFKK